MLIAVFITEMVILHKYVYLFICLFTHYNSVFQFSEGKLLINQKSLSNKIMKIFCLRPKELPETRYWDPEMFLNLF